MKNPQTAPRLMVGLMSGTSADGIEAVVARVSGSGATCRASLAWHESLPFSSELRARILNAALHGGVAELCELNFELGELFAKAALRVIARAHLKRSDIAAIGSHGQTFHHLPQAKFPSTLQLGEPAVIAERTGIRTIANFRVRDMAAGGEGAPLVPYADWVLLRDTSRPRIIQNIGGIGNLTFLPAGARLADVLAFDTGPGNMVIDAVAHRLSGGRAAFDKGGAWAAKGKVCQKLLTELMRHPFLRRKPPKTTGREDFGEPFVQVLIGKAHRHRLPSEDVLATVTAFTARSIAGAYQRFVFPRLPGHAREKLEIILGGGGTENQTLRRMIEAELQLPLRTHEDFAIPNAAKEALAFAILAHETLNGAPSNVPSVTGARRPVLLGSLTA